MKKLFIKAILIFVIGVFIGFLASVNAQAFTIVGMQDTTTVVVKDTISVEEQFLKEISDKALAKEERRKKITNRVLITIVAILLIDRFINK